MNERNLFTYMMLDYTVSLGKLAENGRNSEISLRALFDLLAFGVFLIFLFDVIIYNLRFMFAQ